ncbi:unnamed protein product [Echinostoma caproni]|uniref:PH domain-containing protein n=1 Tax=Echinostoma caproni TaxID=27848 RepID=A0A183AM82_9TREM|nr:unnamed protein product [Echinostoma caproni]
MPGKQLLACLRKSTDSVVSNRAEESLSNPALGLVFDNSHQSRSVRNAKNGHVSRRTNKPYVNGTVIPEEIVSSMKNLACSAQTSEQRQAAAGLDEYDICQSEMKHVQNWIRSTASSQPSGSVRQLDCPIKNMDKIRVTDTDRTQTIPDESVSIIYNDQLYGQYQTVNKEKKQISWTSDYSSRRGSQTGRTVITHTTTDRRRTSDDMSCTHGQAESHVYYPRKGSSASVSADRCEQMRPKHQPDRVDASVQVDITESVRSTENKENITQDTFKSMLTIYISGRNRVKSNSNSTEQTTQRRIGTGEGCVQLGRCVNDPTREEANIKTNLFMSSSESYISRYGNRTSSNGGDVRKPLETTRWASESQNLGTTVLTEDYDDDHFTSVSELNTIKRLGLNLQLCGSDPVREKSGVRWNPTPARTRSHSPSNQSASCTDSEGTKSNLNPYLHMSPHGNFPAPVTQGHKISQDSIKISPLTRTNLKLHNRKYECE